MPTIAVPVRLAMVTGATSAAELFVADTARERGSHLEALAEQLDDVNLFVPVRVGDRVQLVAKHALRWVAVPNAETITLHDHQHHVSVELAAGSQLEGTLLDSQPQDRPRAIDHLNASGRFVRLWTSDEHYLINKLQILQVVELTKLGQ